MKLIFRQHHIGKSTLMSIKTSNKKSCQAKTSSALKSSNVMRKLPASSSCVALDNANKIKHKQLIGGGGSSSLQVRRIFNYSLKILENFFIRLTKIEFNRNKMISLIIDYIAC